MFASDDHHPVIAWLLGNKLKLVGTFSRQIKQRKLQTLLNSDDLYQIVFLKIQNRISSPTYQENEIRNVWAYAVATSKNYLDRLRSKELPVVRLERSEELLGNTEEPKSDHQYLLNEALAVLEKSHRRLYELLCLFHLEGYTWKEIAFLREPEIIEQSYEVIDKATAKYKARGHRAMKRLRLIFFNLLDQMED